MRYTIEYIEATFHLIHFGSLQERLAHKNDYSKWNM